jgi:hypothetical protein
MNESVISTIEEAFKEKKLGKARKKRIIGK